MTDDPSADRVLYAYFPDALKFALRTAAKRNGWDRETWRYQTNLIQEARLAGWADDDALIAGYSNPPPGGVHE
jgi:hypothetical protein